ncbi:MAG: hypothetical protein HY736_06620 [Verrucomicrobia bacterium]|nr:hypothetical protein [Verrucomicrobiota bacterium]
MPSLSAATSEKAWVARRWKEMAVMAAISRPDKNSHSPQFLFALNSQPSDVSTANGQPHLITLNVTRDEPL